VYDAAVLIGSITGLARPSVRLSVPWNYKNRCRILSSVHIVADIAAYYCDGVGASASAGRTAWKWRPVQRGLLYASVHGNSNSQTITAY